MSDDEQFVLFSNARIFDGHSPFLSDPSFVLVRGDRIESVSARRPDALDFREIDLAGRSLLPGLIDAHFHAFATETDTAKCETYPRTYEAQRARVILEGALQRGFTTVRDVGGGDHGTWLAAEQGLFPSPRLFFCGRAFSQTGGHGDARAPHEPPDLCGCAPRGALADLVDGADALRKAAREALRQGAHHLKIFLSGGISTPSDPIDYLQFSDEEIGAVVDEALRRGRYVAAHAYTADSITRAIRLGVRSIEHGNLIDAAAARLVAEAGAFVVPTLATYDALHRFGPESGAAAHTLEKLAGVREKGLEAIRICRAEGVALGFGTDLLGPHHRLQREEFRLRSAVESPSRPSSQPPRSTLHC
ncbi:MULTISPECIES: amidohydrolase family protein [unclassified Sphingopyxis]|uniref:metal-dependent hydrolase family protein n=1 Tax=unclassified Sphingopyxis TaxID=2614943 RepID=UPI0024AE698B|nr:MULTISPECIES: amidohydrolase family protein [unclassified Sphingopyxis]